MILAIGIWLVLAAIAIGFIRSAGARNRKNESLIAKKFEEDEN